MEVFGSNFYERTMFTLNIKYLKISINYTKMLKKLHSNELRLNLATQRKFLNDLYYKLQEDQYVNKKLAANKLVEKLRGTLNDLAKTLALRDKINKEIENQKIKDENEAKAEKAINKIDTNSSALSNADSFLFANTKHIDGLIY